ncbi:unnamed protein product [Cunninghamella echinulata]
MMNSTYVPMDETLTRKRKQEITSISDYVYSSPNSPTSHPLNLSTDLMEHTGYNFGLEPLMTTTATTTATTVSTTTPTATIPFDYNNSMSDYHQSTLQQHHYQQQQQQQQHHDHFNGFNPRRHSVAIGDMDYHTFNHNNDFVKQEPLTNANWNTDLQQFLGDASLPSSFSSHSSNHTLNRLDLHHNQQQQIYHHQQPIPHQRAMSLRLENTSSPSPHDYSNAAASPTTPVFFSPQFLDSLSSTTEEDGNSLNHSFMDSTSTSTSSISFNNNNNNNGNYHPTTPLHHPFSNPVANHHLPSDFMVNPGQLAMQPPTQSSSTSSWTMDSSSSSSPPSTNLIPSTSTSSIKKPFSSRRRSSNKSIKESPPSSPSHTMSTCSPSPPITPSQHTNINNNNNYDSSTSTTFQHTHPSIPEEDDDFMDNRHHGNKNNNNNHNEEDDASSSSSSSTLSSAEHRAAAERRAKNSLITARIIQGANTANQLKPYIQQYLLSNDAIPSGERTITILTSKVAQKSYGTEKRFLCPPPTTILSGSSWWTSKDTNEEDINDQQQQNNYYSNIPSSLPSLSQPKLNVHISGEATSQNGVLEWSLENGTIIDNSTALISAAHASKAGEMAISGKCVSKQLHINDADEKRRRVEVLVKMQLGNGLNFGTLPSKGIKVISKPSKKRQSVKNMELCIHHGTTISLFNRIRSQTVSTKYLGVSCNQPENNNNNNGTVPSTNNNGNNGTCFVARTSSWDPFVIWIVDTSQSPEAASATPPRMPHHPIHPDFPPPPAIAMQTGLNLQSPVAIHYNQPVVLQCVSTGLVSPVMVIRKVDKGSMVLGGNRVEDLSGLTGGECGDEALGDPVSQLHKIAFQIVQDPSVAYHNKASYQPHLTSLVSTSTEWQVPQSSGHPVTYLACLNDVVGMHKTSTMRTFVSSKPPISPSLTAVSSTSSSTTHSLWGDMFPDDMMTSVISSQESTGKVVRKRRVSCDVVKPVSLPPKIAPPYTNQHHHLQHHGKNTASQRRRVNSLNDVPIKVNAEGGSGGRRNSTLSDRRNSISSDNGNPVDGACWTEDVSDAAVWTIVGTDSAKYTFWIPPTNSSSSSSSFYQDQQQQPFNNPFDEPEQSHPITPFPVVGHISPSSNTMLITGENMTRDLSVWFGDIKAPLTEYKSRELISCTLPDNHDLCSSMVAVSDNDCNKLKKLPILLVRGDGIVYRTGQFFTF